MKICNSLTAVAASITSLLVTTAAIAIEEEKMPTYSWLKKEGNRLQAYQKNLIYDSDDWNNEIMNKQTGAVEKTKLVGCREGKCIFYRQINSIQKKYKFLSVQMLDCDAKSRSYKQRGTWSSFKRISPNHFRPYKSYCQENQTPNLGY